MTPTNATTALAAPPAGVETREGTSGPQIGAQRVRRSYPCGTRAAYSVGGCRCADCRQAMADYSRHRYRELAYGRWLPNEPAEESRERLVAWHAEGFTVRDLETATGLAAKVLTDLIEGKRKTIRGATARAVRAAAPERRPASLISAVGSQRRLQALSWVGWPLIEISARSGLSSSVLSETIRGRKRMVAYSTHLALVTVYDELWDQAPGETRPSLSASARARRAGWAPPAAWDEDTIDVPAAKPVGLVRSEAKENPFRPADDQLLAEIAEKHRLGQSDADIARQLRRSRAGVQKLRARHGIYRDVA